MANIFDSQCPVHKTEFRDCSTLMLRPPIEPVHEKTNNLGFRPGLTQTRLHSHTIKLEA